MNQQINLDTKNNNFNIIRFLAASLVLFSHSYSLSQSEEPLVHISGFLSFGLLSVYTFVFISGFLVTKSWIDTQDVIIFIKKRFLRIFPGLLSVSLFTAFIIGPLVTYVPLAEYLNDPLTIMYLRNVYLYPLSSHLPGVFENNPFPDAVNGSLWLIPVLVFLYASLAIFGQLRLINKKHYVALFTVVLFGVFLLDMSNPSLKNQAIFYMPAYYLLCSSLFFYIGVLCYLYRDKIILRRSLAILSMILFLISLKLPFGLVLNVFVLPYLILYFASLDIAALRKFNQTTDLSYGIYLYAFPIQQTFMHFFGKKLNVMTFFIASYFTTLIIAYLSALLIEKPFMKFKKNGVPMGI
jgi:peptidoglycan/LPS O-acetylase OafA/YrhL